MSLIRLTRLTMKLSKEMYKESGISTSFPTTLTLVKVYLPNTLENILLLINGVYNVHS